MVTGGMKVSFAAEHKDGEGRLISRQATVEAPDAACEGCRKSYIARAVLYWLLMVYHAMRISFSESHRYQEIPERYRTGEDTPSTIGRVIRAIIRLRLRR